jgi:hypothetical protein
LISFVVGVPKEEEKKKKKKREKKKCARARCYAAKRGSRRRREKKCSRVSNSQDPKKRFRCSQYRQSVFLQDVCLFGIVDIGKDEEKEKGLRMKTSVVVVAQVECCLVQRCIKK